MTQDKTIIGRAEKVSFPTLNLSDVPAKIDTGADTSAIWCSQIVVEASKLKCVFFGPDSSFYTGNVFEFDTKDVELTRISNSFGHKELRYKVKLPMALGGRRIKATFTLTDRSTKLYPVLIGRTTLNSKFLVDVSRGDALHEKEAHRIKRLQAEMRRIKKELEL